MPATDRFPDSYFANEGSQQIAPAYLYTLTHADGTAVFFTGYENDISLTNLPAKYNGGDPQTFTQVQISHGMSESSVEFEKRSMQVTTWTDNTELRRFFATAAAVELTINIIRINTPSLTEGATIDFDEDCTIVNAGLISEIAFAGPAITATIIPAPFDVDKGVPRYFFQRLCNHPLYSDACALTNTDFDYATTILSIDRPNRTITVSGQDAADSDGTYFQFGYIFHAATGFNVGVESASLNGANTDLVLAYWIADFAVAEAVTVFAGCDHTTAICKAKFSNAANFGGFPFVPSKNPSIHSAL